VNIVNLIEPSAEARQLKAAVCDFIERASATDDIGFNALAVELFRWHLRTIPAYRAYCELRVAAAERIERWQDIPPLPVEAFKHGDVCVGPANAIVHRFSTSGTTRRGPGPGKRGVSAFDQDALDVMDRAIACNASRYLFPDQARCRILVLAPHPSEAPHMIMAHGMRHIMDVYGDPGSGFFAGANGIDLERLLAAIERASEDQVPVCLIGASFGLVHLVDALVARGRSPLVLPPKSRIMDAGGYKGRSRELTPEAFRALMASAFGVPDGLLINLLGMTELSSQVYDDTLALAQRGETAARRKVPPPWMRTRVASVDDSLLDAADGEVGLLVHYDLASFSRPIALLSDDLGRKQDNGFRILARVKTSEPRGCSVSIDELWRHA
jgi:hypothetical protein